MPFKRVDADKDNHNVESMQLSYNSKDEIFGAVCPKCEGYVLLTLEQAAAGRVQCFGEIYPDFLVEGLTMSGSSAAG
jgi:hypothetical protein